MKIEKQIRLNPEYRKAYNDLTREIFGFDFESWYQNGYWGEKHIPYSIFDGDRMVANVSVNIIDMLWNGKEKQYVQLGNISTSESYRNRGYIRLIMEEIFRDYEEKCDGFFLFANDSVLDFYPKFGFRKAEEFLYYKNVDIDGNSSIENVNMKDESVRNAFVNAVKESCSISKFDADANVDLLMFYASGFMSECVYYDKDSDTFVVAELENGELLIHGYYSKRNVGTDQIAGKFSGRINKIILGFVPMNVEEYSVEKIEEENTTFFVRGFDFEEEKLRFPTLAHS